MHRTVILFQNSFLLTRDKQVVILIDCLGTVTHGKDRDVPNKTTKFKGTKSNTLIHQKQGSAYPSAHQNIALIATISASVNMRKLIHRSSIDPSNPANQPAQTNPPAPPLPNHENKLKLPNLDPVRLQEVAHPVVEVSHRPACNNSGAGPRDNSSTKSGMNGETRDSPGQGILDLVVQRFLDYPVVDLQQNHYCEGSWREPPMCALLTHTTSSSAAAGGWWVPGAGACCDLVVIIRRACGQLVIGH